MKKEYVWASWVSYSSSCYQLKCPVCGCMHAGSMHNGDFTHCGCGARLERWGDKLVVETPAPAPDRPIIVNVFYGAGFMSTKGLCDAVTDALKKTLKEGK